MTSEPLVLSKTQQLAGWWERWYPALSGVLAGVIVLAWQRTPSQAVTDERLHALVPAAIDVAGVILGFSLAAEAILMGLTDNDVLKRFKEAGGFDGVLDYMTSVSILSFAMLMGGLAMMMFPISDPGPSRAVCVMLLATVATWMAAAVLRVIRSMQALVRTRYNKANE
ncbi:MAG: hypothetical protein IAG13_12870 [Deltaproteobacteria bacterium]|nr:hypothetical protein [Nannocystaceae bacterium]